MRINHNIMAMNAWRNLTLNAGALGKSVERLSSGLRINRAADDAAGLAISEKMRGQIRGLQMAQRNAQDGISLIQTAEGALNEVHSVLQRMRELAVQAANGSYTDEDRLQLQKEVDQLIEEVDRIANNTEFNTRKLLNGATSFTFHVGANAGQTISVTISAVTAGALGNGATNVSAVKVSTASKANAAIDVLDQAIQQVAARRAGLGAVQNRLEHTIANLGVTVENLQASESRIRDADMASEIAEFTRAQILQQAATAMLAQANVVPQTVLQLLG